MGRWWNRLLLLAIIGITVLSIITIWPTEPHRYLSDVVPWPEGRGIRLYLPTVEDTQFQIEKIQRRAMTLGLDLRGGTRLVLEPEEGVQVDDLDEALEGARDIIERRVNEFGVAESEVTRLGDEQLDVQLPGIDPEEAAEKIGRTALLQFCQPVIEESTGRIAIARTGTVQYQEQTCQPVRDEAGNIVVEGGTTEFAEWPPPEGAGTYTTENIVWQPATADVDGEELALDGRFLDRTVLQPNPNPVQGAVDPFEFFFLMKGDGTQILEQVTTRLAENGYPMASFLDGEPIRGEDDSILAPQVSSAIPNGQGVITGLSTQDERDLSRLLNIGSFPIALRVVQQQDVDATLGETAVRNSVIAGLVALGVIMLFMVLYYRLPGFVACLALVTYTSVTLAVFKLWPVTLTLAGVAAFILSVGMAVDANILVFERLKEEMRAGRNIRVALEDGFNRAWSSIRDSNVATIITCGILYWFGNQFGEASIKGFAITLAIGVVVSMFSAIIVTRTYMRFVVGWRWAARRPWLFAADAGTTPSEQAVPAMAGGSGDTPAERRERR
jgi:preprotein translocase subunit SecD